MRLKFLPLLVAITVVGTTASAQGPVAPPTVTTNGSAQIRVVPDLADLSFEVEVRHADLATARKDQAERAAKVLAALRAAGIPETELQSSQVQIAADYTDRRQETDTVRFYRVTQTFSATLHDLQKVPDVTTDAVKAGATGVSNANFRTSQLRRYRDEARAGAIRAAKEKATALAGELGAKVGKPHTITEGASQDGRYSTANGANFQSSRTDGGPLDDGTTPAFAPGTISVSANVTVAFLLE